MVPQTVNNERDNKKLKSPLKLRHCGRITVVLATKVDHKREESVIFLGGEQFPVRCATRQSQIDEDFGPIFGFRQGVGVLTRHSL